MPDSYTMPAAAVRIDPQRQRALERANAIRLARAELKRQIAEGEVTVADVLREVPPAAASWAVWDLLMSQHRWGTSKCRKFLWRNQITETKPVGALTERQRILLASQLEATASAHALVLV